MILLFLNGPIIIQKSNKQSMLAKKSIAKNLLYIEKPVSYYFHVVPIFQLISYINVNF